MMGFKVAEYLAVGISYPKLLSAKTDFSRILRFIQQFLMNS